jgi:hypothetical protein
MVVGIDCLKLLVCLKQLCNFVSQFFNLLKHVFGGFSRVQYQHKKEIALWFQPVLNIRKVTNELPLVVTARRVGTAIGAKEQSQVERFVGPSNDRSSLTKAVENLPAVSARAGISLQRSTPSRPAPVVARSLTEVLVNSEEGTGNLSVRTDGTVRKSPFPSGPQVLETMWAPRAVFRVEKRTVFRTRRRDKEIATQFEISRFRHIRRSRIFSSVEALSSLIRECTDCVWT